MTPVLILATLAAGVFLAGLAWRLSVAWRMDPAESFIASSRDDYFEFARSMSEIGVMGWSEGGASAFRGIGYPALISIVEDFQSDRRPWTPVLQAILGAAEAPLAAAIAMDLFSPEAGFAAGAMAALHTGVGRSIPGCQIETLFGCLVCLIAWALVRWCRAPSWRGTLLLSFFIGISLLCRAVFFAFPAVLILAVIAGALPSPGRGKLWTLIIAPYLLLAPWLLRNAVQFGRIIPFEDHAATRNFYAATRGVINNTVGAPYQDVLALEQPSPKNVLSATPEAQMFFVALRNIRSQPGTYLISCLRRLIHLLSLHPLLLFLAIAGAVRRRAAIGTRALAILCGYYAAVLVPMTLEVRYMEPMLPILAVLSGGLVPENLARLASSRIAQGMRRSLTPAALLVLLLPFYLLCVERLGAELVLTSLPCRLPRSVKADYHCGQELLRRGDREAASSRWRQALAALGESAPGASYLQARLEISLALADRPGPAVICRGNTFRFHSQEVQKTAIWFQDHGRLSDALWLYDALLACHPDDPRYLTDRAVARALNGSNDLARLDFLRALEVAPGDASAGQGLGVLLEQEGRPREALAIYERVLESSHAVAATQSPQGILLLLSSSVKKMRGGNIAKRARRREDARSKVSD